MRVTAVVTHEPPWYVARCVEIEVASQGESVDEALDNLRDAVRLLVGAAPGAGAFSEPAFVTSLEVPL